MIRTVIADDADDIRHLVRFVLERDERFAVVGEAADGEQALDLVDTQRPDLLVLDLAMPRMDGLEVLAHLREWADPPSVVVLSGFTSSETTDQALGLGATAYVAKGGAITELPEILASAVR